MREAFIDNNFHGTSLRTIEQAVKIITELQEQGYVLTLRQLYYQFVRRNWLKNTEQSYKRLGEVISMARLAGMIDWDAIEDRTRYLHSIDNWPAPAAWIKDKHRHYAEDLWIDQNNYVEVWIEKDALVGVIERPCNKWRVPFFSCRGYASQSAMYEAGQRLKAKSEDGYACIVLHLGDHDPSGIDMTRDIAERLDMFSRGHVEVQRLALTYEQVEQYAPPPNPAKVTDSRYAGYSDQYGAESWELDALEPSVIAELVEQAILYLMDREAFDARLAEEGDNRNTLLQLSKHYDSVINHVWSGIRNIG